MRGKRDSAALHQRNFVIFFPLDISGRKGQNFFFGDPKALSNSEVFADFFGAPEQRKPETVKHKALKNWGLQLRVSALPDRQK